MGGSERVVVAWVYRVLQVTISANVIYHGCGRHVFGPELLFNLFGGSLGNVVEVDRHFGWEVVSHEGFTFVAFERVGEAVENNHGREYSGELFRFQRPIAVRLRRFFVPGDPDPIGVHVTVMVQILVVFNAAGVFLRARKANGDLRAR